MKKLLILLAFLSLTVTSQAQWFRYKNLEAKDSLYSEFARFTDGAGIGKFAQSDALGNLIWTSVAIGGVDSFYVKNGCDILNVEAWKFSNDTIYIDTCELLSKENNYLYPTDTTYSINVKDTGGYYQYNKRMLFATNVRDNYIFGDSAGYSWNKPDALGNYKCKQNVFIGTGAGKNHFSNTWWEAPTISGGSVAIGHYAGYADTSSFGAVMIGLRAGYLNKSPNRAILIGNETGKNSQGRLIAFGDWAGRDYTGGDGIFIGDLNCVETTTATAVTVIGNSAYIGGNYGVIIGRNAQMGSGTGNVAIGYSTGKATSSGSYNTFVGTESAQNLTSGQSNVSLGREVFPSLTSGSSNIGLGTGAGYGNSTGSKNLFLGDYSGRYVTGDANICIGYLSGFHLSSYSNRLIINSYGELTPPYGRGSLANDTTLSIIYGYQTATSEAQKLYLNSNVVVKHNLQGNPTTGVITATDTIVANKGIQVLSTFNGSLAKPAIGWSDGYGLSKSGTTILFSTAGSRRFAVATNGIIMGSSATAGNAYISNASGYSSTAPKYGAYSSLTYGLGFEAADNVNLITSSKTALQINSTGVSRFGAGATNNVTIDTVNALRLNGSSTVWEDLVVPLTTAKTANSTFPAFSEDSLYYTFYVDSVAPNECFMYFIVQMPHKWKEGSNIYPHVHYKHTTAQGTPTFTMKYKWINYGATTAGVNWSYKDLASTTGTTNNTHQMSYSATPISGSGKTISSILLVRLYLKSQTGTGNINAWQFDVHYEIDALGSKDETAK